jgi:hypothetical protein
MVIVEGLGGPLLGVLAGLFFAALPLTMYFGRMIDHVAPVQFFSLLMLHGYLQWSGLYPRGRRGSAEARLLPWLAGAPAVALAAVVLHILAGCAWDLGMLPPTAAGHVIFLLRR